MRQLMDELARKREVLAHIGGALLAAQVVERFLDLLLKIPGDAQAPSSFSALVSNARQERQQALAHLLSELRKSGPLASGLETDLKRFLRDRNKLAHSFAELGRWDFTRNEDCERCVQFLRDFIDRAASLQHLFVSALSARNVHLRVEASSPEADRYASEYRRVYEPLAVRWFPLVSE